MPAPQFHPFARLFFCAAGLLGATIVMGLVFLVGSVIATVWTGLSPAGQLADISARYALPLTVLSYPVQVLWVSWCRTRFDRRSFVSLGLRARRALPDWSRGAATGALSIALLWSILWITGGISVVGWSPEAFEAGLDRAILALIGYAIAFLAVGFFEELLFRGYALHNFNSWLGWKSAVAAQAIIFALIHLGNVVGASRDAKLAAFGALPSLILIAVFFALCYRKTGSLWFPIGFHFAWNFCLGCVFSLPVSGIETFRLLEVESNPSSWLSGGAFGAEGSFLLIPILLALIFYISKAPDHPQAILDLGLLTHADPPIEVITESPIEEDEDEERESRFRTKFGTSQGFSAETLRELRDLQEARERAEAEAKEATQREEIATSSFAPPAAQSVADIEIATVAPEVLAENKVEAAPLVVEKPVVAEKPVVVEKPAPVVPPSTAPQNPTPKPKPPSPRW
ncbi:MAG TPA: CPBP family glutamic-type intramembrane protease [Abditibacterium sp.]|jgi:hypothetical protein